jgi:hypothetical protein
MWSLFGQNISLTLPLTGGTKSILGETLNFNISIQQWIDPDIWVHVRNPMFGMNIMAVPSPIQEQRPSTEWTQIALKGPILPSGVTRTEDW